MTRILVISDLHCGNRGGLTHPSFDKSLNSKANETEKKFQSYRKKLWNKYEQTIKSLQPSSGKVGYGQVR